MPTVVKSTSRKNYSPKVEEEINDLIKHLWGVSRTYTYLSSLCQAQSNLRGFRQYFHLCAIRSRRNADRLTQYQIVRGGLVDMDEVKPIEHLSAYDPIGICKFLFIAFDMEKRVEQVSHFQWLGLLSWISLASVVIDLVH